MSSGTLTVTYTPRLRADRVEKVVCDWVSHTDGTVSQPFRLPAGILNRFVTDPGTPAPTVSYDITILDSEGIDILSGHGVDRAAANSESIVPLTTEGYPFTVEDGNHTFTVANAGSGAAGQAILYITIR